MRVRGNLFLVIAALLVFSPCLEVSASESAVSSGDLAHTLNRLISRAKDGQLGYETAAKDIQDPKLQKKFKLISEQRGQFADQLTRQVLDLGAEPETEGSFGAAIHRGWINFKSSITGKNHRSIISEIQTGENVAVEAYEEALQKDLPREVREVVQQQAAAVKENYQHIQSLKNQVHYEETASRNKGGSEGMERGAAGAVDIKSLEASGAASEVPTVKQIA